MLELGTLPLGPVTASLVLTSSGSAVADSGSSKGIGNKTDLELLLWLRSRAKVVLTSGLTARVENYRMPSSADLAVLSRGRVARPAGRATGRFLELGVLDGYHQAIVELQSQGYSQIHTEFGPRGFLELVRSGIASGVLSAIEFAGVEAFVSIHDLALQERITLPDLEIALVAGRG